MRAAIIDLGTNTFNLLIYEPNKEYGFEIIHSERKSVGLGLGGINESKIAQDAQERALKVLIEFRNTTDKFNVEEIKAFGTSALRDAKNKKEFLTVVEKATGIKIDVIDGLREAELIYTGVKSVHKFKNDSCIMDIGGGSTEFIFVNKNGDIDYVESCNIGVARIIQKFDLTNPLNKADEEKIINFLNENTTPALRKMKAKTLIGASGSFETFLNLTGQKLISETESQAFNQAELIDVLKRIKNSTQEERNNQDIIIEIRKKMLHIAAFKILWAIDTFGIKKSFVSPASLKEGVVYSRKL